MQYGQYVTVYFIDVSHRYETAGLRLLNTNRNDTGIYRCEADNNIGDTVTAAAKLRVEGMKCACVQHQTLCK